MYKDKKQQPMRPAKPKRSMFWNVAKEHALLPGKGGLSSNTLRIKPPMCITKADADFVVDCLDEVLSIVGKQSCGE